MIDHNRRQRPGLRSILFSVMLPVALMVLVGCRAQQPADAETIATEEPAPQPVSSALTESAESDETTAALISDFLRETIATEDPAPQPVSSAFTESAESDETTAALISDFLRETMTTGEGRWPFVPLNNPEFVTASEATYINAQDLVLGLSINGESKAYPTSMMWFHHVANDTVGGEPVAVTY